MKKKKIEFKDNVDLNRNIQYYITCIIVIIMSVFVFIPVLDMLPAQIVCLLLYNYFINNKIGYAKYFTISIIMIILYSLFLKKLIEVIVYAKSNYKKYIHIILILVLSLLIFINNQFKKLNGINKYFEYPKNISYKDFFN